MFALPPRKHSDRYARLSSPASPNLRLETLEDRTVPTWLWNGHLYDLTTAASNWNVAEAQAVSRGGHLVAINSAEEQNFINTTILTGINEYSLFWIGLTDQQLGGYSRWVTNEPVTFNYWKFREPNNSSPGEHWICLNWNYLRDGATWKGTWNDTPLDGTRGYGSGTDGPYRGIIEIPLTKDINLQSANYDGDKTVRFDYSTTGNPGPFEVGLYRSTDGITYNPADQIETKSITPNAAGGNGSDSFTLPAPIAGTADYPYVMVVADPSNAIQELNEDNNTASILLPITDIEMLSAKLVGMNTVQFTYDTKGNPGSFTVGVFRSADDNYDLFDQQVGFGATTPIAGQPTTDTVQFDPFSNLDLPYLIVVADPITVVHPVYGVIKEINETNNAAVLPLPDIALKSAWLTSTNEIQFPYQTTGYPAPVRVGLYRSGDVSYDPSDVLISSQVINLGQQGVGSLQVTWPGDPTKPYLLVVADPWTQDKPNGLLLEQDDRGNNVAFVRPASVDLLAYYLVNTFPGVRITDSEVRSIPDQAAYMLAGALQQTRDAFVNTYGGAWYAQSMYNYLEQTAYPSGPSRRVVLNNPDAYPTYYDRVRRETLNYFERLVVQARASGSNVSNHLDGTAVDITVPAKAYQQPILSLLSAWNASVITLVHGTGPHWHISYTYWRTR